MYHYSGGGYSGEFSHGGDIRTASCNCEGTEQLQRRNNSLRGWGQYGKITMKCTDIADAIRKILKSIMQRGI